MQCNTMKETQNAASLDSEIFGNKETNELNYSRMDAHPKAFEPSDRDDSSNCKVIDDFSVDNENGTIDSPTKEGQKGFSNHLSDWDKDADSLSFNSCDIGREQSSHEHDSSRKVADSPCNGASDLYETNTNLFTDKVVLECALPELEVCYQEIDCQILKDICVDEGRHEKDINVIESCNDGKSRYLFPQAPNDKVQFEAKQDSPLEYDDCLNVIQCGSKEENDGKTLVSRGRLESSFYNSSEKDSDKVETNSSEEGKLVCRELPVEDFGEANNVPQLPNQVINLDENPVADSPTALPAEAGRTGKDAKTSILSYNSKVESQSITFNFKSPVPKVVNNVITENVEEQSESEDLPIDVNAEKLSGPGEVQCTSNTMENDEKLHLIVKNGNSDAGENAQEQSPEHKDTTNSIDSPIDSPADDVQAVEPDVPWHERENSGNVSVVSQLRHDEGETSFSAASLVNYSEPVAFSGSLSYRSDGSTTSAKSFAFPILQSEWNSSPVRMAKADRRHFRKHKGWRSGLLCCRF